MALSVISFIAFLFFLFIFCLLACVLPFTALKTTQFITIRGENRSEWRLVCYLMCFFNAVFYMAATQFCLA